MRERDFYINLDLNIFPKIQVGDAPIFAVDDDIDQLFILEKSYEMSGRKNSLLCYDCPLAFLEEYRKSKFLPSLILLDINMPKIGGFDILKEIRYIDHCHPLPWIIMVSSSEDMGDIDVSSELLATGFFSKPSGIEDYIKFFNMI